MSFVSSHDSFVVEIGGWESSAWTTATVGEVLLVAAVGALILFALDRYAVDVEVEVETDDGPEVDVDLEAETDGGDEAIEDD